MGSIQHSELLRLAQTVLQATSAIVKDLEKTNQPEPTFSQDSSVIKGGDDYEATRIQLNDAAHDLLSLVNGPLTEFRAFFTTQYDLAAYQIALELGLFGIVPLGGSITLSELARKVPMDEDRCGRVVKHLASQHVFHEIEEDVFEHSAASALVAKDSDIEALLLTQIDEMFRAASESSTCVLKAPFESDSINSPFATRHRKPLYGWYADNPAKGGRFAKAMAGVGQMDRQISELRNEFPWETLGGGKVVDVGGGSGHVSIYLASQYPELKFVVQDSEFHMLAEAQSKLTPNIAKRVQFMQHDFFSEQPVTDASAFFMRQCTHNWNDRDCIKIFRALVPALEKCKPGTRLLINDAVLPELNQISKFEEHSLRQFDMAMFVILGAKQRSEKEFRKLLQEADSRFEVVKVHGTNAMGLVEAFLNI
jgi:ubiquinone/menaquinone biosynthesis C-methylase UbiE